MIYSNTYRKLNNSHDFVRMDITNAAIVVIMKRQLSSWEAAHMWNTIKTVVVATIVGMMTGFLFQLTFEIPVVSLNIKNIYILILGVLGLILVAIGLLTNIKRQSKAQLGTINRAEFYGAMTIVLSIFFYMNTRIDQIMIILVQHP